MSAKKLLNNPADVVREMLEGIVATTPGLALVEGHNVVVRADVAGGDHGEVAVICGGGSGHEPAHAGYVGPGMLHAAVAGDVFASPSTDAVLAAIRAVTGPAGALLVIKNYTGDRLNFGLAAAIARSEGHAVEMVIVADDVAIPDDGGTAGRRGIAGTVLVNKVAGAAAAAGLDLAAVRAAAEAAMAGLGTMGVALAPCVLPGADAANFELAGDEIELGLGIHGEAGVRRAPLAAADAVTDQLLEAIVADRGLRAGDRVVLMVNDLGTTTPMELAVAARRAAIGIARHGLVLERAYCGRFLSALDMAGLSLSLMRVDDERLALFDAATGAAAWPNAVAAQPAGAALRRVPVAARDAESAGVGSTPPHVHEAIRAVCGALLAHETELTALDRAVGDGDLGQSLARGARALAGVLDEAGETGHDMLAAAMAAAWRRDVGGTSGPLYAVFLVEAGARLGAARDEPSVGDWADAFQAGCEAIAALGGASLGDRTMLDALLPAAGHFRERLSAGESPIAAWQGAVAAAHAGAEATRHVRARRGRSSYLGDRVIGTPDPGAVAAARWLSALADHWGGGRG